jgi:hypothetical protein
MPGRFVQEDEIKLIHADWWDEHETVTIKRFTYGDRQRLAGVAYKVGLVSGDGNAQYSADVALGEMNIAILEIGIKAWTLKGANGKPVPLRRSLIEKLRDEDGNFILGEINALNPSRRRSAEAQATFRDSAGNSFEESDELAA